MSEDSKNNLSRQQPDDEVIADNAVPLCPKCLKPLHPLQSYCADCDSNEAINPLASYMPFVNIRLTCGFFGKAWRAIWYDEEFPIALKFACLVVIVLFAPILLIVGLPLLLIGKSPGPRLGAKTTAALYLIAFLLLVVFIYFYVFRTAFSPVPFS
jgi:hypothetical protein